MKALNSGGREDKVKSRRERDHREECTKNDLTMMDGIDETQN